MKRHALVSGCYGRVGRALMLRLPNLGFAHVHGCDIGKTVEFETDEEDELYAFECSYNPHDIGDHVRRAMQLMGNWRDYTAIFVPSSYHIGTDTDYGRSKMVIESAARFYNGLGARIVTDRIGYFPGDGVQPNPNDPMIDKLVDGDTLVERIVDRMYGVA